MAPSKKNSSADSKRTINDVEFLLGVINAVMQGAKPTSSSWKTVSTNLNITTGAAYMRFCRIQKRYPGSYGNSFKADDEVLDEAEGDEANETKSSGLDIAEEV
ncbi:hypothetical protein N7466_002054 [Penicillium verhagenii]|uniref:uncharacterized protein n=1 Tax=Penicillium verhagenii TaxID=1562060 RepID=UPI002544EFA7|nr:uncharacterized protein N7466_002054 [Penicillium verhagenii]KAJ5938920.1 hypothetical protein N7466_002054 [Penicillium verhagenii]